MAYSLEEPTIILKKERKKNLFEGIKSYISSYKLPYLY
jgi:hypothetical protein